MEKTWQKPARVFVIITFVNQISIACTFGTYVLFLISLGLTPLEVNLVNVAFFGSRFIGEVITGVIADRYGRKISCTAGFAGYAIGLCVYWSAVSFLGCVIAEVILAAGACCVSGALDAWIKDEMDLRGATKADYHGVVARAAGYEQIGLLIGAPLGGLVAWHSGLAASWLIAALGSSITFVISWLLIEETRHTTHVAQQRWYAFKIAWRGMRYAAQPGKIRVLFIITAGATMGFMVPNMQWAPTFAPNLGEGWGTGVFFMGVAVALWIGARIAPHLLLWTRSEIKTLAIALGVIGVALINVGIGSFPWSAIAFFSYEIAYGVFKPIRKATLNNTIESEDRATILSCDEMLTKLAGMMGLIITGGVAEYLSRSAAWLFGGSICLLIAWYAWQLIKRPQ